MIIAGYSLECESKWKLDEKETENVNNIEIIVMLFEVTDNKHAGKRAEN